MGPVGRLTPSRRAPQSTTSARAHTAASVTVVSMRYDSTASAPLYRIDGLRAALLERRGSRAALVVREVWWHVGRLDRAHAQNVARRAIATQKAGHRVVVIVSAMSGETNRLLALAHEVTKVPDAREMDAIAATGEQGSAKLTRDGDSHAEGGKARSLLGHQVKVPTDAASNQGAHQGHRFGEDLRGRSIAARSRSSPASRESTTRAT